MAESINQAQIFLPVLALVLLTIIAFVKMAAARGKVMKGGDFDATFYRAYRGAEEPEYAVIAARHWDNLFQLPTLFYAACTIAFVLNAVGVWTLGFAWAWVALRIVQSATHLTSNNPAIRGMAFSLSMLFMIALWVNVAMSIIALV